MNQDQAATTLDPAAILGAAASDAVHTEAADGSAAIDNLLDLEERIVFDLADRVVPDGDRLVAAARGRHQAILDAIRASGITPESRRLVEAHVHEVNQTLYPQLLDHLDPTQRADLAAALEEARLSRQEPDDRDLPPAEATEPAAGEPKPRTGERQAAQNRADDPPA